MTPFQHLHRSLFCGLGDWMSIFTIYCDDSGTDKHSRVASVAGYLGKVSQWEKFQKEWRKALREFGVRQMHRAELESFKGEFKQWNGTLRTKFLQRVQPIIREHMTVPIGSAVIKDDFHNVIPRHIQEQFGGVYGWCAHDCLVAVSHWYGNRGYRNRIQWVFEAGTIGHGQVDAMFRELNGNQKTRDKFYIKGWSFQDKSVVPLQAADVLAYEVFKQVTNQIVDKGEKHDVRFSMKNLIHATDDRYLKYWGKQRLIEWREEWNRRLTNAYKLG